MMRRLSRRCGGALAAASALLVACASPPQLSIEGLTFRPTMRTTLVSNQDLRFVAARQRRDGSLVTVLALQRDGASPRLVAQLTQVEQPAGSDVAVQWFASPAATNDLAAMRAATIEQLYAMLVKMDPKARYCMGVGVSPCDPVRDGTSHAEILRGLAEARATAPASRHARAAWQVVELAAPPGIAMDADIARVRVTRDQTPLRDAPVFFDRAPHSLCQARTDAHGVAECRLVDQKGDEHTHDHNAPIVATYPGAVSPTMTLLPTTAVLKPPPQAQRPSFARPFLR